MSAKEGMTARFRWVMMWAKVYVIVSGVGIGLLFATLPIYLWITGTFGPEPGSIADIGIALLYFIPYLLVMRAFRISVVESRFDDSQ